MLIKCLNSILYQQSFQLRIFNHILNNHKNLFRSSSIEYNSFGFVRQLTKMPAKKTNTKRKVLIN
jgi:hypothetical protein